MATEHCNVYCLQLQIICGYMLDNLLVGMTAWPMLQVSEAAGKVKVPAFKPKQGVHIETDPKGTAKPVATGDDTAVIEDLISQLEVCAPDAFAAPCLVPALVADQSWQFSRCFAAACHAWLW